MNSPWTKGNIIALAALSFTAISLAIAFLSFSRQGVADFQYFLQGKASACKITSDHYYSLGGDGPDNEDLNKLAGEANFNKMREFNQCRTVLEESGLSQAQSCVRKVEAQFPKGTVNQVTIAC